MGPTPPGPWVCPAPSAVPAARSARLSPFPLPSSIPRAPPAACCRYLVPSSFTPTPPSGCAPRRAPPSPSLTDQTPPDLTGTRHPPPGITTQHHPRHHERPPPDGCQTRPPPDGHRPEDRAAGHPARRAIIHLPLLLLSSRLHYRPTNFPHSPRLPSPTAPAHYIYSPYRYRMLIKPKR